MVRRWVHRDGRGCDRHPAVAELAGEMSYVTTVVARELLEALRGFLDLVFSTNSILILPNGSNTILFE